MTFPRCEAFVLLALSCAVTTEATAELYKNQFASVMLGEKKIGHVHFMSKHDADGVLQELKTRSSLSLLGVELYHHTLHVHETWKDGELQHLWGNSDDHGDTYEIELRRHKENYSGTLNNEPVTLPHHAFPTAVWHYPITRHPLLFTIPGLNLQDVKVVKSADRVKIGEKLIPAEKFVFSGDWDSTLWFDRQQQFLQWSYQVKGREVTVVLDP